MSILPVHWVVLPGTETVKDQLGTAVFIKIDLGQPWQHFNFLCIIKQTSCKILSLQMVRRTFFCSCWCWGKVSIASRSATGERSDKQIIKILGHSTFDYFFQDLRMYFCSQVWLWQIEEAGSCSHLNEMNTFRNRTLWITQFNLDGENCWVLSCTAKNLETHHKIH